jgi:type VI secretion system secreted protein VgrG
MDLVTKRNARLSFERGDESLEVRRVRVVDRMSELFAVEVEARSPAADLDLDDLLGYGAALEIAHRLGGAGRTTRTWSGIVSSIEQTRVEPSGLSTYRLTIAPSLWQLGLRRNDRLFQHQSVPEIVGALVSEWSVPCRWEIDANRHPKLELRTQYGESDYAFARRLLEEAGIAFYFDDATGESVCVFCDAPHRGALREQPVRFVDSPTAMAEVEDEHLTQLRVEHVVRPAKTTVRDFDFRRPGYPLFGQAGDPRENEQRYEQYHYQPGAFLHEGHEPENTPTADDKAVARHGDEEGASLATRALEGGRAERRTLRFATNAIDLRPGRVFRIAGHPRADVQADLSLAVEMTIEGEIEDAWVIRGRAVSARAAYRPIRTTRKPRIHGAQSVMVVGPPGEEIHTDEFGRIRIQFHWDREGKSDENSSCWVRVAQGWAGGGYGLLNVPRVGHEVLVTFLDGDPDHPLVTGRVFNAATAVPYKLPENKTVSTWRSDSSPGSGGFNEIRFDDAKGRELVYFQAEKDHQALVKNNEMHVVGAHRSKLVRGDESGAVAGSRTELVRGMDVETVGVSRTTTVGVARHSTVGVSDTSFVGSMFAVTIARELLPKLSSGLEAVYQGPLAPILSSPLTSTLGEVPQTPLGAPLSALPLGPMSLLQQISSPPLGAMKGLAEKALADDEGPPATGITMIDKKIALTTGGASIILDGEDIILSAVGEIRTLSQKNTEIVSKAGDVILQGGPMVRINPGTKSPVATCMKGAAAKGAAFIGGGSI